MIRIAMARAQYVQPSIVDYGSLPELTRDFDIGFAYSMGQLVFAVVSTPIPGGGGGGGGGGSAQASGQPIGSGSPGASSIPGTGTTSTPTSGSGLETLGQAEGGGSGGGSGGNPSGGSGGGGSGGGDGGKLPFTGLAIALLAGVGAAMAGTGAAIRSALRRG